MTNPTLLVVGAGHIGRAVSELATWLGLRTVVWDDRADIVAELGADIGGIAATHSGPITDVLRAEPLGPDDAIVIVTRNVKLDLEILPHILASEAGYVGLMGSERRWSTTRAGLAAAGVAESDLDRLHAPIGVEIHAETPEEIGVSILAEVIGARARA